MRKILRPAVESIRPCLPDVLAQIGIPNDRTTPQRTTHLVTQALDLLDELAAPIGILQDVTAGEFETIYRGEGRNEPSTPLSEIFPHSARMALFVVTLGEAISARIRDLFADRDFALASMLDAAASEGTEKAGDFLENDLMREVTQEGGSDRPRSLRYSPGYCGWHISGQRALLAAVKPDEIGVTLRESFLMQPLKSMSGVIVAGKGEIHDFVDDYPFCAACATRGCRERIRAVSE